MDQINGYMMDNIYIFETAKSNLGIKLNNFYSIPATPHRVAVFFLLFLADLIRQY